MPFLWDESSLRPDPAATPAVISPIIPHHTEKIVSNGRRRDNSRARNSPQGSPLGCAYSNQRYFWCRPLAPYGLTLGGCGQSYEVIIVEILKQTGLTVGLAGVCEENDTCTSSTCQHGTQG